MKWLFHFRVGGELASNNKQNAEGIGHGKRCIKIINHLHAKLSSDCSIITRIDEYSRAFFRNEDIDSYHDELQLEALLTTTSFDVIVSDVNFLEERWFEIYRSGSKRALIVCLAPRGEAKYYSDLSFLDFPIPVHPRSQGEIYSGTEYFVTDSNFSIFRRRCKYVKEKKVILSMGGVDRFNSLQTVLDNFGSLDMTLKDWEIEVVVGYFFKQKLDFSLLRNLNLRFVSDPKLLYENLCSSALGVFGGGIVTYEAMGLGVGTFVTWNTNFLGLRAKYLHESNLAIDLGCVERLNLQPFIDYIESFDELENYGSRPMVENAMNVIDGNGAQRIIYIIQAKVLAS